MTLLVFNPEPQPAAVVSLEDQEVGKSLLRELVAEVKKINAEARSSASERSTPVESAMALLLALRGSSQAKMKIKDCPAGRAVLNATPQQQVAMVLITMATCVRNQDGDWVRNRIYLDLLKSLLRRKLPYDHASIETILQLVAEDAPTFRLLPVLSIVSNLERFASEHRFSQSIKHSLAGLVGTFGSEFNYAEERKIGRRLQALLDQVNNISAPDVPAGSAEFESLMHELNTDEAWTNSLRQDLQQLPESSQSAWCELLQHCGQATASKPSKKWLTAADPLVAAIGPDKFMAVLLQTLAQIGQVGACQKFTDGTWVHYGDATQIHDTHADMLRGLVWSASFFNDEAVIGALGDAAEKCFQKVREIGPRCPKIGNACLLALSRLASPHAIAQLGRLQARAKHASTRKQITRAFERAAEAAGMTEADLVELSVPTFGLQDTGTLTEPFQDFVAEVIVHANRKPELLWKNSAGKTQKSVPAQVKADAAEQVQGLKKKIKDIATLVPSIRSRVERLLRDERRWPLPDFYERYAQHPLVGVVANCLIWVLEAPGKQVSAFWTGSVWVDVHDQAIDWIDAETTVTSWHPLQSPAAEVMQWRQWLEEKQITQPFKQAHREIYILTDAERQTKSYSNRFASHIVRQHQFAALCQQRGWKYALQGDFDSCNVPALDLPEHDLRAEFHAFPLDEDSEVTSAFIYVNLATEQVCFCRAGGYEPVPLAEVPPRIFSEVMRDVDLFVGVASVANDPDWRPAEGDPHFDYWQQYGFGELSATAATRKEVLGRVVPRLAIADQCRFEGRFLVVAGILRTYKIHLGSGNVLMSPNDQYLCIVPKRGSGTKRTDNLYLPFAGDNTLSVILSKALLLAQDDKIKDLTIANQIRRP